MSVAALVAAACISLSGGHITAGDLAKAVPGFTPSDPDAVVAWSPAPGVTRTVRPAEVTALLTRLGASAPALQQDVCFQRAVSPLTETAVLQAMRLTLGKDSIIELLEVSRFPVPDGEIVFPRETLTASIWHGYVHYDQNKKFPIWARVQVRCMLTRVVAVENIPEGKPIQLSQLRLEQAEEPINGRSALSAFDQVEGMVAKHTITANSPIWADSIDLPQEVLKGDRVTIKVRSGLAVLTFSVEALTPGRRGDLISLKNPDSGKMFRARVEGPKTVAIDISPVKP